MAAVTFEFRSRGAARVQRDMQRVIDSARAGAAMLGRLNTGLATTAQQAQQAQRNQLLGIGALQRAARGAEREQTGAAREGSRSRVRVAHDEARERSRELMRWAEGVERAERRATAASERNARARARGVERERDARVRASTASGARFGERVAGGAMQFGSTAHGMMQDARRSRAGTEHTLNSAFYQAGVGGAEANAMRQRIINEVTSGSLRGLSADQVASSLAAAQTQFSVLSRGTEGLSGDAAASRRSQNLDDMIRAASFARDTYQDPSEVMRVAGMLSSQGVTGENQRAAIMAMTGIAQAGSIELGNVTREALGPLMQNIAVATARLGAGATAEQRSAAVRDATVRTLAVGEVGAAAGLTSRDSLNAYAKLQRNLQSDVVTGRLFEALSARGAGGQQAAADIFTTARDTRGRTVHRVREGMDPLAVMGRLQQFAGNSTQLANLLQGGGGEAMILDAQVRRFLGGLSSQTAGGQSMADRVNSLVAQGRSFGEADVRRGASVIEAEQATQLQAQEEQRLNALSDNTQALNRASNALASWASQNPLLAQVAGGAAGGGMSLAAGAMGRVAGQAAATSASFAALQGAVGSAGAALGNLGAVAGAAIAGLAVGQVAGDFLDRTFVRENRTTDGTQIRYGNNDTGASLFDASTWRSLGREIRDAFESNPPVVRISPQAAAQAAGVARTQAAAAGGRT